MNLNISYNWLKEYLSTKKSSHEFAKEISLCGPSVDFIHEKRANFEKVVVGEILEISQHPNADKLHVCKVNVGKETLQIVCGAPNIEVGQKVPAVLVGGKVGDMEIKQASLRGVDSFGMLCSQRELGIGDDHSGIYILPNYVELGLPIEKIIPIEDDILDIEVTSNRPDAMNIIGIAREASAIMGEKFLYQDPTPSIKIHGDEKKLSVSIKEDKLCSRYQAVVMDNVKIETSPLWMQQRLLSAGLRPINNLVDITNYILLEFGQPLHVFDYNKLEGQEINVRLAKKGEKILALDGKVYELNSDNLIIADEKNPVAIAGVMGGELSAAHQDTQTIVFEAANFNPVSIRKTARVLNLHSDSSNLFEKSLSPEATQAALLRAIELTMELAGGKVASKIVDEKSYKSKQKSIKLSAGNVTKLLGVEIKSDKIKSILSRLGFEVTGDGKTMTVAVPWWREKDIEGEHDLIEEIARIYGYHNLPSSLPTGEIPFTAGNQEFYWADKIKDILSGFGLSENYNYSFISEKLITNSFLDVNDHIQISNPLSADFEYMRTSLIPGLLQSVAENENNFENIDIFELSKIYIKKDKDLADEKIKISIASVGKNKQEVFLKLKGFVEGMMEKLHIDSLQLNEVAGNTYWDEAGILEIKANDEIVGHVGLINQESLHLFGIKKVVAAAETDFYSLIKLAKNSPSYESLPKYPGIELDLSIEIDTGIPYAEIIDSVKSVNDLIKSTSFLSEYHGDKVEKGKKALAIRITYRDKDKTLKLEEVQEAHKKVVTQLEKKYNIKVR